MKTYLITRQSAALTISTAFLAGMIGSAAGQTTAGQASMPPPPPNVQSAPASGASVPFYDELKPHGVWMEAEPFGMVWQPTIVVQNRQWRPYCDGGQWVWLNNAWCWQSEYEWGRTPFHYGRWMQSSRHGWVWIPGNEWSAGWVSWRKTDTHYHWAPTPVDRSAYVSIGRSSSGSSWGFEFELSERHYVSRPCGQFVETVQVQTVNTSRGTHTTYSSRYQPAIVSGPGEVRVAVISAPEPVIIVPACRPQPVCRPVYYPQYNSCNRYEPRDHHESRPHNSSSSYQSTRSYETVKAPPARAQTKQPAPTDRRTSRVMDIMSRSRK